MFAFEGNFKKCYALSIRTPIGNVKMSKALCVFCEILKEKIPAQRVYEDKHIIAIRDKFPKASVHVLVMPKKHIQDFLELCSNEHEEIMRIFFTSLPKIAKQLGLDSGFRFVINTGKEGGQSVFHLHAHVMGGSHLPEL